MDRDFQTSKVKDSDEYLIFHTDSAINELVADNYKFRKAFNYYNGVRDADQFRHLEENYGIGTPTQIEFTPVIRKHIDVLVGEFLSLELKPKISCKDKNTITNIFRDKQLEIENSIHSLLKNQLTNSIYSILKGVNQPINDRVIEDQIKKVQEDIDANFISEYEKAGQNVLTYICQAQWIDFKDKLKRLIKHLLITGTCYYRVKLSQSESNIDIEVLNPLNTFVEKNSISPYLKDGTRAVIRRWLTKTQILTEYAKYLEPEHIEYLKEMTDDQYDSTYVRYVSSGVAQTSNGEPITDNMLSGVEVTVGLPSDNMTTNHRRFIPVYEVEWLAAEYLPKEKKAITKRYKTIRVGTKIYILIGEDETVFRSAANPDVCGLSLNGMYYSDENSEPFSLILKTAHLQDKFDILHFFRDNIIANSGTVGDWIDISMLPTIFGNNETERLLKWNAYKKAGMAIIDTSQEGRGLNTTFGGFDDSVKLQAIQAVELAIQSTENTISTITGVFRERIGGVEQKDAVTNVEVGVRQSMFITKQYYQVMDLLTRDMLIDSLNYAKIAFKDGLFGTTILGDHRKQIFTALPEHFTFTDYDVHIVDSSKQIQEKELIKQLSFEFIKAGNVDADVILDVVTSDSLTESKDELRKSIRKKSEENNVIQKLQEQLQQAQQQIQEVSKAYEQASQQLALIDEDKSKLEREKMQSEYSFKNRELEHRIDFDNKSLELESKQIDAEKLELLDSNPNNDEIKNI